MAENVLGHSSVDDEIVLERLKRISVCEAIVKLGSVLSIKSSRPKRVPTNIQ